MSTTTTTATRAASKSRVPFIIYRTLLRWCKTNTRHHPLPPLDPTIPPITLLHPHHIDDNNNNTTSPSNALIEFTPHHKKKVIFNIKSLTDIESSIKYAYRLTNKSTPERIGLALECLKNLNDLVTPMITLRMESRQRHSSRSFDGGGVEFRVGQVVRHKRDRWRGVIVAWTVTDDVNAKKRRDNNNNNDNDNDNTTNNNNNKKKGVYYRVIMDKGDTVMYNPGFIRNPIGGGGVMDDDRNLHIAREGDLELVEESSLKRIRNPSIEAHFSSFDISYDAFQPNEILSYEYPLDRLDDDDPSTNNNNNNSNSSTLNNNLDDCYDNISSTLISHAVSLLAILSPYSLTAIQRQPLSSTRSYLRSILTSSSSGSSYPTTVDRYLSCINHIHNALTQRDYHLTIKRDNPDITYYPLGTTIRHKKYNYRGIIVGWDPTPTVDVSSWDGLRDLTLRNVNVMERPFYHVIPVPEDCVRAFGGERGWRYVCDLNMEVVEDDGVLVRVDNGGGGLLDWEWKEGVGYIVPDEMKFRYAEDMGEEENDIVNAMETLRDHIPTLHQQSPISQTSLTTILQNAPSLTIATLTEDLLKDIWKSHYHHPSDDHDRSRRRSRRLTTNLRALMEQAIQHIHQNHPHQALSIISHILTTHNPRYAEAWNKKGTCHYLLGQIKESKVATERALELEPRHFGAWGGLGLIYQDRGDEKEALRCYKESLRWHPWGVVSSRLGYLLDRERRGRIAEEEEEGAKEGSAPYE